MTTHSTRTLRALEELQNCVFPFFKAVPSHDENCVIELRNVEYYGEFQHSKRLVILNDGSFTACVLTHELAPGQKFGVFDFSAELVAHLGELCAALREEQGQAQSNDITMKPVYEARLGVSSTKAEVYSSTAGYKVTGYVRCISPTFAWWKPVGHMAYKELYKAKKCATIFAMTRDLLNEKDVDKAWHDLGIQALL